MAQPSRPRLRSDLPTEEEKRGFIGFAKYTTETGNWRKADEASGIFRQRLQRSYE